MSLIVAISGSPSSPSRSSALDYALRPVLVALGAQHIVNGLFVLDKTLAVSEQGVALDADVEQRLAGILDDFAISVTRRAA
jgi:FMN reductase